MNERWGIVAGRLPRVARSRQRGIARWLLLAGLSAAAGLLLAVGGFHWAEAEVPRHRDRIEAMLHEVTGAPASVGDLRLAVHAFRPRLELRDVRLDVDAEDGAPLHLRLLRLDLAPLRLVRGDLMPAAVEISGLSIDALRDADGNWALGDISAGDGGGAGDFNAVLRVLARFERIVLSSLDLRLSAEDEPDVLPLFVDALEIRRASSGWALAARAGVADTALRAELDGRIRGQPDDPADWRYQWQLSVHGDLPARPAHQALLPGFPGGVGVEGALIEVDARHGRGEVSALGFRIAADRVRGDQAPELTSLELRGEWQPRDSGWALALDHIAVDAERGAWPSSSARLSWRPASEDAPANLLADAGFLRLDEIQPWVRQLGYWPEEVDDDLRMRGELRGVVVRARIADAGQVADQEIAADTADVTDAEVDADADIEANARAASPASRLERLDYRALLDGVEVHSEVVNLDGIAGEVSGDINGGMLRLQPGPLRLELPRVLSAAAEFSHVDGGLRWRRDDGGWRLDAERLEWMLDSLSGEGSLALRIGPDRSPYMDLRMRFAGESVDDAKPYMPLVWGKVLREWLDQAIEGARVPEAELRIVGDLDRFPWHRPGEEGRFEIDIEAVDGRLRFAPDWPGLGDLAASLRFRGNGLRIEVASGAVQGGRIQRAVAEIPDFSDARLSVEGRMLGDLAAYYRYLRRSPLRQAMSGLLDTTTGSGQAQLDLWLDIPLFAVAQTRASGDVRVERVEMRVHAIDEVVSGIRGVVRFDNEHVQAERLEASFRGRPLTAHIERGEEASVLHVQAELDADAPGNAEPGQEGVAALLPDWLRPHLSGRTPLRLEVDFGGGGVLVASNLQGLNLDLPAPLNLPPAPDQPLRLRFGADGTMPEALAASGDDPASPISPVPIDLRWGDRLHIAGSGTSWRVHFGPGRAPPADGGGLQLSGTADTLDLPGWMRMGETGLGEVAAETGLRRARVHAGRIVIGDAELRDVAVALDVDAGAYRGRVEGGASGEFAYYSRHPGHLEARLDALSLHGDIAGTLAARRDEVAEAEPINPTEMPTVDLLINSVRFNDLAFGALDVQTRRVADGIRLEHLRLGGGLINGEVQGSWLRNGTDQSVGPVGLALRFALNSDRPGDVLDALGYADTLSARDFHAEGALQWPGAGRGIALSTAEGELSVRAGAGTLHAVEPGAGRMLGLFNFYAVPRRLALNFRDVVGEGLAFDRLQGSFRLADGNARTEDLRIVGPSLRVEVAGRVGLAARDYDQNIRVVPEVSGGVTLGALLLGGPAAGILALMVRELFEKPLDQVTQLSYRLTGSWDNPQITPGDVSPAEVAPAMEPSE